MARGDVININLPLVPGSRVQGGRRPAVLVIRDEERQNNPMVMIVPLTSNLAAARFPLTLEVHPSASNGLSVPSIALVFQLCAADRTQVVETIGRLEDSYLSEIDRMLRRILGV